MSQYFWSPSKSFGTLLNKYLNSTSKQAYFPIRCDVIRLFFSEMIASSLHLTVNETVEKFKLGYFSVPEIIAWLRW